MKRKNFDEFSCEKLIILLDEHLNDGWSHSSFPSKINMTSSTFHSKKKTRPKFLEYYERKRPFINFGKYRHGLSSFIKSQ